MSLKFWLIAIFLGFSVLLKSQVYTVSGFVLGDDAQPLPGAAVRLNPIHMITSADAEGKFIFKNLPPTTYSLEIKYLGFEDYKDTLVLTSDTILQISMKTSVETLEEVVVFDHYADDRKRTISLSSDIVDNNYISQNIGSTLMNSIEKLPGVDAMNIGSGQSKPVIRGLGFNRVVVVENGVSHEGQQWGADHGLEIDQYAIDRAEIIRGPASLMYGSDAIGGVIDLRQIAQPIQNSMNAEVELVAKSNNNLLGGSGVLSMAKTKWHFTIRSTMLFWADMKVPADYVDVYSYRIPLHNNRLRNTAGQETDVHFSFGYTGKKVNSRTYISLITNKSGFFANAHGLEPRNIDTIMHDYSDRDILFPRQEVMHLKVINQSRRQFEKGYIEATFGYQKNQRKEFSIYTSHGFMPPVFPENMDFSSELERGFDKSIINGNLKVGTNPTEKIFINIGYSSDFQDNKIDGRGFIIPAYRLWTNGLFSYLRFKTGKYGHLQGGVRFDMRTIKIDEYYDWFESMQINGSDTAFSKLLRADKFDKTQSSFTWSIGYNHSSKQLIFKTNFGKSFRFPMAQELAANGVNYHYFRFEKGNNQLNPEIAYQLDAAIEWNTKKLAVGFSPFATWFVNYIYLNPAYKHDLLYGNGHQIYEYTQSQVFRAGGEIHIHISISQKLKMGIVSDYVYSLQMSGDKKGFSLPFSPPATTHINWRYGIKNTGFLRNPYIAGDFKIVASQKRIVPPEEITAGFFLVDLSAGSVLKIGETPVEINFQVQNLLNRKYFNHLSYYRLINLPEAGRNFVLSVKIPFTKHFKSKLNKVQ